MASNAIYGILLLVSFFCVFFLAFFPTREKPSPPASLCPNTQIVLQSLRYALAHGECDARLWLDWYSRQGHNPSLDQLVIREIHHAKAQGLDIAAWQFLLRNNATDAALLNNDR